MAKSKDPTPQDAKGGSQTPADAGGAQPSKKLPSGKATKQDEARMSMDPAKKEKCLGTTVMGRAALAKMKKGGK